MRLAFVFLLATSALLAQTPAPAAPPGTDIVLLPITAGVRSLRAAVPQPVSVAPGYDNQPSFDGTSQRLVFTAMRDGKQTDIYEFNRRSRQTRQLTRTSEGEYSATIPPVHPTAPKLDRDGFTVIRVEADGTQRLWQFDRDGANPQLVLADIKPVGYHAWIDADRLALFVLGKPATLQLARVSTGSAEVMASDIGRSLHLVPGTRAVSFVQKDADGTYLVKQLDVDTKKISTLIAAVAGSSERDCAWMPDGSTLLMSAGARVFAWTRGSTMWVEVFDGTPHKIADISRLAVAPDGSAVALVVAEPTQR